MQGWNTLRVPTLGAACPLVRESFRHGPRPDISVWAITSERFPSAAPPHMELAALLRGQLLAFDTEARTVRLSAGVRRRARGQAER